MKILKIREGYTTNSSSSNEWVPGTDDGSEVIEENIQMPQLKVGEEIIVLPVTPPLSISRPVYQPSPTSSFSSEGKLGALALFVFSLFLIPKFYRSFKKRIKK